MFLQLLAREASDVACLAAVSSRAVALWGAGLGLAASGVALWGRARAAASGHGGYWAFAALCAAALQVFLTLGVIPTGCTTREDLSWALAAAFPWCIAAVMVRGGIAPAPPPLTPREDGDPPRPEPWNPEE